MKNEKMTFKQVLNSDFSELLFELEHFEDRNDPDYLEMKQELFEKTGYTWND